MIHKIVEALAQRKAYLVIAIATLAILAYAVPYGMDVEAKNGDNNGKHYGLVVGDGYGLSCDHFKPGQGPLRCR